MLQELMIRNIKPMRIDGNVPTEFNFDKCNNILIKSKHQSYLTHGIHKFPAKFFPELPRYLINKYSKREDRILDPMCGSGTTLLEGLLLSREVIGIDIDPMARLITKVKTTPVQSRLLDKARVFIQQDIRQRMLSKKKPAIPEFNYRNKWFKQFILEELGNIKES
ncbi:hypothetical protein COT48_00260, partial [Candidatus Woesearchaeota archaeon CG08_land_8_20_14_0_20_47_9]